MEENPSDSPASEKDSRSYHRTDTECPALYRSLASENQVRKAGHGASLPHLPLPEGIERGSRHEDRSNAQVFELFLWLDWRINSLIKMMSKAEDERAFPLRALIVNISASGLKFYTDENLSPRATLEFQIILPVVPFKELLLRGDVTWVKPRPKRGEGEYAYEAGLNFNEISEGDRDHIIRYGISRELQIKRLRG
jgi:hypothetical protein